MEDLAISRACELFGVEYANVQPHSGSGANMGVYFSLLNPGDRILAMDLSHGGHLTHGSGVSFSGKLYDFCHYGLNPETETIDLNMVEDMAKSHKPKMIVAGASAYARTIDFEGFAQIAKAHDAIFMVDMAHIAGLVAAGLHPTPVGHADVITSTTHKTLRGPRGGLILAGNEYAKKIGSQIFPGIQGGPLMHVISAKAVSFHEALQPEFVEYQKQVLKNTKVLAKVLMDRGYKLVSNGTDNHLVLVDFSEKDISGKDAEERLGRANITVNKNTVPNEKRGPFVTSGVRIGMPLITSRGMKEDAAEQIATFICDILDDESKIESTAVAVKDLCTQYPLYA